MKKIIFTILIFLLIPLISAKPIYSVNGWLDKTKLNPDEKIELKIGFIGEGNLSYSRIKISSDGNVFFIFEDSEKSGSLIIPNFNKEYFNQKYLNGISYAEFGVFPDESGTHPLLRVDIKSPQEGDHRISIEFLYKDQEGESYIAKKDILFHINTWQERNNWWLQLTLLILAILALFFGGAYSPEIKAWIRKKFKS